MSIDLTLTGDNKLRNKLDKLERRLGKTIVNRAMRASAKRLRPLIAAAVPVDRGVLKKEIGRAKIRVLKRRRVVGVGIQMPTREALGIPDSAKGYYPFAVEYGYTHRSGTHVPANSYVRKTVDTQTPREQAQIGRDIGSEIERRARKT